MAPSCNGADSFEACCENGGNASSGGRNRTKTIGLQSPRCRLQVWPTSRGSALEVSQGGAARARPRESIATMIRRSARDHGRPARELVTERDVFGDPQGSDAETAVTGSVINS